MKQLLVAFLLGLASTALMADIRSSANGGGSMIKYELPQFGHYVDTLGIIYEQAPLEGSTGGQYALRSVEDLIKVWSSRFLVKSNVKPFSLDAGQKWVAANYRKMDRGIKRSKQSKEIVYVASIVAYLGAEYDAYGLNVNEFLRCFNRLNALSGNSRMLKIFGGMTTVQSYRNEALNTYNKGMLAIEEELRRLMMPLEAIHRQEFQKWVELHQEQYAKLKKLDDDKKNGIIVQAKIDESIEAVKRAEAMAAAAEAAAQDAYWAAENARREANDRQSPPPRRRQYGK